MSVGSFDIPRIIVGTSSMGSVLPLPADRDALRHLDEVLDAGCTAFDLAASYQVGGTERLFGAWIASRKNRERLFLVSKGAHPFPIVAPHRLTARCLEDDLNASLARLHTDRIDLYFLHRDDESARLEPVVDALVRFRAQGKILAWGASNFTSERIERIAKLAEAAGFPIGASSPHFSLFAWTRPPFPGSVSIAGDANASARALYEKMQLPTFAWSPLGAGFAAGRASRAYDTASNRARLERANKLAARLGVAVTQVALAYVLDQPFPTFAITSSASASRMKKNLEAASITLGPADVRFLETGAS